MPQSHLGGLSSNNIPSTDVARLFTPKQLRLRELYWYGRKPTELLDLKLPDNRPLEDPSVLQVIHFDGHGTSDLLKKFLGRVVQIEEIYGTCVCLIITLIAWHHTDTSTSSAMARRCHH